MASADSQHNDELAPNVAGIESEVHVVALGHAPPVLRWQAAELVRQMVLRRHGLSEASTRKPSRHRGYGFFGRSRVHPVSSGAIE